MESGNVEASLTGKKEFSRCRWPDEIVAGSRKGPRSSPWPDGSRERMPRVGRGVMDATGKNRENNASPPSEAGNARSKRVSGVKVPVGTVRYYVLSISYISRCMRGFSQALGTRRARYISGHTRTRLLVCVLRISSIALTNQADIVSRHESIGLQPFYVSFIGII